MEELLDFLDYCEATGQFTWKKHYRFKFIVGKKAGCICKNTGYIKIRAKGKLYLAHRLAWFFANREDTRLHIDHIDGNRANNAISNLRVCTKQQNAFNQKDHGNLSGYKGITKHKNRWTARIMLNGKNLYLGLFDTKLEAAKAYDNAAINLFKEFARTNNA